MAFLAGDVMYHVSTTYHSPFVFDTSTFIPFSLCLCISVLDNYHTVVSYHDTRMSVLSL